MPSTATHTTYPHSPLVKTLQSLSVLDSRLPHSRFVATVGQFIDFSEAFSLSVFLDKTPKIKAPNDPANAGDSVGESVAEKAKAHYLQARGEVMTLIVRSFAFEHSSVERSSAEGGSTKGVSTEGGSTEGGSPPFAQRSSALRLPQAGDEGFNPNDDGLSAYLRFYSLYQSEMESRVLQLHTRIRRQLTSQSSGLAQLAALDGKLGEVLTAYSRKALRVIPVLLTKRFHYLHSQYSETISKDDSLLVEKGAGKSINRNRNRNADKNPGKAIHDFLREMQCLLLAELDCRLQPTLGLIDALCSEFPEQDKKEEQTK
ncbi:hypothetical protein IMCC1989_2760 [gamma proteobacterium IMCC1989]|nr:hypothetical protein IMCC1989_2760 [gamma proteobacterium IMCC1989]